jgi:hypothetical protein
MRHKLDLTSSTVPARITLAFGITNGMFNIAHVSSRHGDCALVQIKFEAEQKIAEARGNAEALTMESNALKSNPQIQDLATWPYLNAV